MRPAALQPAHILIVDDDPSITRQLGRTVEAMGHRTSACHTWTEALRAFESGSIDLVLIDAVMPSVDGFKLTRLLRGQASSYVPILFLTGLTDHASRVRGIEAGADDFLTKPIDEFELRMRIVAMLRIRALTRDLEEKTRTLRRIASMDALTGIQNRRAFDRRLGAELKLVHEGGAPLSVLMIDLDHFKTVNDRFGHPVGDALLRMFGKLLSLMTRACDVPFRYGGEEFVMIAQGTTTSGAMHLAERIRSAFEFRSREATVAGAQTCSIGVAGTDVVRPPIDACELVTAADSATYRAKKRGRNCVCRYNPRVDSRAA